jgi:predicted protein tyrosine phosphatase
MNDDRGAPERGPRGGSIEWHIRCIDDGDGDSSDSDSDDDDGDDCTDGVDACLLDLMVHNMQRSRQRGETDAATLVVDADVLAPQRQHMTFRRLFGDCPSGRGPAGALYRGAELWIGGVSALQLRYPFDAVLTAVGRQNVDCVRAAVLRRRPPVAEHMIIEIDDAEDADIAQHFAVARRFIRRWIGTGAGTDAGCVLVHCMSGHSRSVTLVANYLCAELNTSADHALALIRRRRPLAAPNRGFMQQLRDAAAATAAVAATATDSEASRRAKCNSTLE